MANKILIGVLLLVVLSTSIYVMLPDKIRIDIQPTKTIYRVYEDDSWVLAATERVNLFDGTKKMRAKNRSVTNSTDNGIITIYRIANYKDSISTYETYIFDSTISDVELVPISHKTTCINCVGKILQFEYRDILYEGETKNIVSPFSFGHNMKLTWQSGTYMSKVYQQKVASDKIRLRYRPVKDIETFEVRLFDPLIESVEVTEIQSCKIKQREVKDMGICTREDDSVYINNKTKINTTVTYFNNYTCQIGTHKETYSVCTKIGYIVGDKRLICPVNHRCDKIGNEICILDCNDGDCNYNAKYVKDNRWTLRCFDTQNMPVGDFKINRNKKPVLKIETI